MGRALDGHDPHRTVSSSDGRCAPYEVSRAGTQGRSVALRKSAGAKRARDRKAKAASIAKQAVWLELWRGHDDEAGEVTLADGLEDVEVTFNKRRRGRWSGSKSRRRKRSSTNKGSARRVKAKRRPGATSDSGESSDSDCGSESSSNEEACEDIEMFELGEMLRIYWTEEKVWFRCAIKGLLEGGRLIQVEYMHWRITGTVNGPVTNDLPLT